LAHAPRDEENVLDYAARSDPSCPIVFTDALADDASDRAAFESYRHLASVRRATLVAVLLECEAAENQRRLVGRTERLKLTKPHILADLRAKHRLLRPEHADLIELDITRLTAEEAARAVMNSLPDGQPERKQL
jgi:hypothetical protein